MTILEASSASIPLSSCSICVTYGVHNANDTDCMTMLRRVKLDAPIVNEIPRLIARFYCLYFFLTVEQICRWFIYVNQLVRIGRHNVDAEAALRTEPVPQLGHRDLPAKRHVTASSRVRCQMDGAIVSENHRPHRNTLFSLAHPTYRPRCL
jgi:hypothetical protein